MKTALFLGGLMLCIPACREKPSKEECVQVAKRRRAVFFGGKQDRTSKRAAKLEYETSLEECLSSWSKEEAQCVAKAKNRNQVISCR